MTFEFSPRLHVLGERLWECRTDPNCYIEEQTLLRGWKKTKAPSYQESSIKCGKVASYEQLLCRGSDRLEDKWGKYQIYSLKD